MAECSPAAAASSSLTKWSYCGVGRSGAAAGEWVKGSEGRGRVGAGRSTGSLARVSRLYLARLGPPLSGAGRS